MYIRVLYVSFMLVIPLFVWYFQKNTTRVTSTAGSCSYFITDIRKVLISWGINSSTKVRALCKFGGLGKCHSQNWLLSDSESQGDFFLSFLTVSSPWGKRLWRFWAFHVNFLPPLKHQPEHLIFCDLQSNTLNYSLRWWEESFRSSFLSTTVCCIKEKLCDDVSYKNIYCYIGRTLAYTNTTIVSLLTSLF